MPELGKELFSSTAPWCNVNGIIKISWESWTVVEITCWHGTYRGVADGTGPLIDIEKAYLRALTAYKADKHPTFCYESYQATEEKTGLTYTEMCGYWSGHDGPHGEPED